MIRSIMSGFLVLLIQYILGLFGFVPRIIWGFFSGMLSICFFWLASLLYCSLNDDVDSGLGISLKTALPAVIIAVLLIVLGSYSPVAGIVFAASCTILSICGPVVLWVVRSSRYHGPTVTGTSRLERARHFAIRGGRCSQNQSLATYFIFHILIRNPPMEDKGRSTVRKDSRMDHVSLLKDINESLLDGHSPVDTLKPLILQPVQRSRLGSEVDMPVQNTESLVEQQQSIQVTDFKGEKIETPQIPETISEIKLTDPDLLRSPQLSFKHRSSPVSQQPGSVLQTLPQLRLRVPNRYVVPQLPSPALHISPPQERFPRLYSTSSEQPDTSSLSPPRPETQVMQSVPSHQEKGTTNHESETLSFLRELGLDEQSVKTNLTLHFKKV